MAHNLEFDADVQRYNMFCVGDVTSAWHHLGQRTPQAVTWREASDLAGLGWDIIERPLYFNSDITGLNKTTTKVDTSKALLRSTDGRLLGIVGADYQPINNRYAFDFVDAILEAENGAHYESAGALGCGERIWTLARIPGADFNVLGVDPIKSYLLFATSHDGSMSATVKITTERVVCQNTFNSALRGAGQFLRIRHTKNAHAKLEECKQLMSGVSQDVQALARKMDILAERKLTRESMEVILARLFPKPKEEQNQTRRENLISSVLELYESNDGNKIPEIRGSAFNLFNAITQFTDHHRTARLTEDKKSSGYTLDMARAEAALFGSGDSLKTDAMAVIFDSTTDAPAMARGGVAVAVAPEMATESIVTPEMQAEIDASIADLDIPE